MLHLLWWIISFDDEYWTEQFWFLQQEKKLKDWFDSLEEREIAHDTNFSKLVVAHC